MGWDACCLDFLFFRTTTATTNATIIAATTSPIMSIVAKLAKSELIVWETVTLVLVVIGLALCQPVAFANCQEAVAVSVCVPSDALVGIRTEVSTSLFVLAVRLNRRPDVKTRVPLDQKSDANDMFATLIVS